MDDGSDKTGDILSEFVLERMTAQDVERVSEIENDSFSEPWSRNAFEEALESDFHRIYCLKKVSSKNSENHSESKTVKQDRNDEQSEAETALSASRLTKTDTVNSSPDGEKNHTEKYDVSPDGEKKHTEKYDVSPGGEKKHTEKYDVSPGGKINWGKNAETFSCVMMTQITNEAVLTPKDSPVVGYIGVTSVLDEAEITNVAIDKSFRGRGYGSVLMEKLLGIISKEKITRVFLEVRAGNEAAKGLYKKHGFEKVGVRKNFYRFPTEDAIVMMKEL